MHRNTAVIIVVLAILVALLIGIKIGQRFSNPNQNLTNPTSSPVLNPAATALTNLPQAYTNKYCGVSLTIPADFTVTDSSESATLVNSITGEKIDLVCASKLPKPPLAVDKIEEASISGQKAKIYHDKSAKDGKAIDVAIFTNPKNKLEVALFGIGVVFKKMLETLQIL